MLLVMDVVEARLAALQREADRVVAAELLERERRFGMDMRAEGAYRRAAAGAGREPTAAEVLRAGGLDPGLLRPGGLPDLRAVPDALLS